MDSVADTAATGGEPGRCDDDEQPQTNNSRRPGILAQLFQRCDNDPKGSIHRAWAVTMILMLIIVIVSSFVAINIKKTGGSKSLMFAAIWTVLIQLFMSIVGSFVLRRFPTQFSVGFLLGLVVIVAQQNLITFATFNDYYFVHAKSSGALANLSLLLFICNIVFALMLYHFREAIFIQTIDNCKNGGGSAMNDGEESGNYENFEEENGSR